MAQDVGTVYVQVQPSGKGFGKTIEGQISPSIDNAGKTGSKSILARLGGAFGKIGKIGTGAVSTVAGGIVALAAKGGFSRALNIENAQAKLKGLGHSTDSVREIMNDALASVKGTAFGLGDAATVAASLSASGVTQGSQLTNVLKTVADTAQISGRSLTDVGAIFGSVAARGKLQGDDMLQLMSSGVPVLQFLGKHLGKTSGEISDMVSKGKIDFQTFADAMQEGLGGAALSAGKTFAGAWDNVKAALSRTGETLATPILNGLRGLFNQAIPLIDSFTAAASPIMQKIGSSLQKGLENALPAIGRFFTALKQDRTVQDIISALGRLGQAVLDFIRAGTGMSTFGTMLWNLRGLIPPIINAITGVVKIMTGLIGFVNKNANWLAPLAAGIGGFVLASKGIGKVSGMLADIPKALTGITGAANGVIKFITIVPELGGIGPALKSMAGGMSLVKNAQSAWNAITTMTSTVWRALGAVIAANPIGAIIVAITAVVGALVWFFTQTEAGRKAWAAFTGWLQNVWNAMPGFFTGIWNGITGIFSAAVNGIRNAWQGIVGWFQNLWNNITTIFTTVITAIGKFLQSGWGQAILFFINPIAGLVNFVIQHFDTIKTIITNVLIVIAAIFVTIWNAITTVTTTVWNTITSIINTALAFISGVWSTAWTAVSTFFADIWNGIVAFLAPIIQTVSDAISAALAFIQSTWNAAWRAVSGFFSGIWNGIVGFIGPIAARVGAIILGAVNGIRNVWNSVWSSISGFFSGVWNSMIGAASRAVGAIGGVAGRIYGVVMGALQGAGSWLVDVGKNIIQGLINGIGGAFGWLKDKITSMGSSVLGWAKGVLGIHSPSKLFRNEVGVMVGRGMALGIDDSLKTVRASVRSMSSLTDQLGFNPGSSAYPYDPSGSGKAGLLGGNTYIKQTVNNPVAQPWPLKTSGDLDRAALGI
jgi:tape measure domain-containing protein